MSNPSPEITREKILRLVKAHAPSQLEKTEAILNEFQCRPDADASAAMNGMLSYMRKALDPRTGYHNCAKSTEELAREAIGPSHDAVSRKVVIDLGCGPGALVDTCHRAGVMAVGVDLCPFFAAKNRRIVLGDICGTDPRYLFNAIEPVLEKGDCVTLVTSLTLDRVPDPEQLLRNMKYLAGKAAAITGRPTRIVIATILPVVPRSDDKGGDAVVYSTQDYGIYGRGDLAGFVRDTFGERDVCDPRRMSYSLVSSREAHSYTLYVVTVDSDHPRRYAAHTSSSLAKEWARQVRTANSSRHSSPYPPLTRNCSSRDPSPVLAPIPGGPLLPPGASRVYVTAQESGPPVDGRPSAQRSRRGPYSVAA